MGDFNFQQHPQPKRSRLGSRLRSLREEKGITLEQLADRMGIGADTLGKIESGEIERPPDARIRAAAQALGVSAKSLFDLLSQSLKDERMDVTQGGKASTARTQLQEDSLMGDFNNQWIEIFRAGNYGDRGNWQREQIDKVIANFKAGVWTPPAVFGHPAHDDPAHGWVSGLRREGDVMQAQFSKTTPQLENAVQDGRFPNRSAAFYLDPQGKGPVLRHVGFLGATPPEVKGLTPIQFLDGGKHVSIEFKEETVNNPNPNTPQLSEEQVGFLERLRKFFGGDTGDPKPASFTETQLQESLKKAVQPLQEENSKLTKQFADLRKEIAEGATATNSENARLKVAAFIEKQRAAHRWVPAFDKAGLPAVLAHLAGSDATVSFGEGDKKKEVKLHDAFTTFLESLPELVPSGELAGQSAFAAATGQPINIQHTEVVGIERAQRARAIQLEALKQGKKVSYAEARQVVMAEEAASGQPTIPAGGASAGGA